MTDVLVAKVRAAAAVLHTNGMQVRGSCCVAQLRAQRMRLNIVYVAHAEFNHVVAAAAAAADHSVAALPRQVPAGVQGDAGAGGAAGGGCGLWVVGCGLWVVGCGLWFVGCGLCVVGCVLFSIQLTPHLP